MKGKDVANDVADWVAGKANSRMLFLFLESAYSLLNV